MLATDTKVSSPANAAKHLSLIFDNNFKEVSDAICCKYGVTTQADRDDIRHGILLKILEGKCSEIYEVLKGSHEHLMDFDELSPTSRKRVISYLTVAIKNACINHFRTSSSKERQLMRLSSVAAPPMKTPDEITLYQEQVERLLVAKTKLSQPQRSALDHRFGCGTLNTSAASERGLSPGSTNTRISRALSRLYELLREKEDPTERKSRYKNKIRG